MTTSRCAADDRCVGFDRREHLAAEVEHGPLCEGCLVGGERAVNALPFVFVSLEQLHIPSLGSRGDGQPAAKDEHQVPLNLRAEALQSEIWWVATTWEEVLRDREKLSESVTRQVRAGWAVQAACQILQPRVRLLAAAGPTTLVGYPSLDETEAYRFRSIEHVDLPGWRGVADLRRLHNRARGLLGLISATPERIERVPCRDCDLVTLYRTPGEDMIRCGSCGALFTVEELRRWTGLIAEHLKQRKPRDRGVMDRPQASSLLS